MIEQRLEAYVIGFEAEHRQMHRILRRVDETLRTCEQTEWAEVNRRELVDCLIGLVQHLEHHFAQEEEGGYLEEAVTYAPRYADEAKRLGRQHADLMTRWTAVVGMLQRGIADATAQQAFTRAYRAARRDLLAHEADENAVVEHAYNIELDTLP